MEPTVTQIDPATLTGYPANRFAAHTAEHDRRTPPTVHRVTWGEKSALVFSWSDGLCITPSDGDDRAKRCAYVLQDGKATRLIPLYGDEGPVTAGILAMRGESTREPQRRFEDGPLYWPSRCYRFAIGRGPCSAREYVWHKAHADFRGEREDGTKVVNVLRAGGTWSVPVDDLTEAEIAEKL